MVKSVYKTQREEFKGTDVNKKFQLLLLCVHDVCVCVCIWGLPMEAREQLQEMVASYDQWIWDGTQAAQISSLMADFGRQLWHTMDEGTTIEELPLLCWSVECL